jgi:hypothetical protein
LLKIQGKIEPRRCRFVQQGKASEHTSGSPPPRVRQLFTRLDQIGE